MRGLRLRSRIRSQEVIKMRVERLKEGLILAGCAERIFGIWDTILEAGQGIEPHFHEDFEELYYILSGRGEMRIGGEEESVGEGDVVYIPKGKVHTIRCSSGRLRFVTLTVSVDEEETVPPYIA